MPETAAPVEIKQFKGLNLKVDPAALEDNELTDATNVNIGLAGELVKRTGLELRHNGATLGASSTKVLGHFLTDTISQLIVKSGNNVYYSTNGTSYTLLGAFADASWGVQYAGNFYILRTGNTVVKWDGTTATSITGSPSGTFGIIYKERLFVLNSNASGSLSSRLYFSSPGDLSATGWPGTNFFDVQPGDGDYLTSLAIIQDLLLIFKGRGTWALYVQGQLTDWIVRSINAEIGCISKYALRQVQGYLYISSYQGIYRTDGYTYTDISQQIGTVFANRVVNLTTINVDAFGVWNDQLICLISPTSGVQVYYVYHYRVGAWTKWEFGSSFMPQTFTEVRSTTLGTGLYAGDGGLTGYVFRYGSETYSDNGVSYNVSIITKEFNFDLGTRYKRGKWMGIDIIGDVTVSYRHTVDYNDRPLAAFVSTAVRNLAKVPGPGFFRVWKFSMSISSITSVKVLAITLHMAPHNTMIGANT